MSLCPMCLFSPCVLVGLSALSASALVPCETLHSCDHMSSPGPWTHTQTTPAGFWGVTRGPGGEL